MAIETVNVSPQPAYQVQESKPQASKPAAAEQSEVPVPTKPRVPDKPKIEIDRQPVISQEDLAGKIAQLNETLRSQNQAVAFSTDAATGHDVVQVTNRTTGELIRQMPSMEALKAMQNMDRMMGLIFNHKT